MPSPFYNVAGRLGFRKLEGTSKVHDIGTGFQALGTDVENYLTSAKSIIATEQSRENTAYGVLATPDEVNIVLPENGLIAAAYQATWKESVAKAARAAIFVGANQLKIAAGEAPSLQDAVTKASESGHFCPLATGAIGLVSSHAASIYSGDATTGQLVGDGAETTSVEIAGAEHEVGAQAGPCYIFAAAGTYKISVQFKASSGSVIVKNRRLWAWVVA